MTDETEYIDTENIEIELLLRAIYLKYGYDFRGYARASVKRRVKHRMALSEFKTISHLQGAILHDRETFNTLLNDMSVNVTQMFRDPSFYGVFKDKVIPLLARKKMVKIWHAGLSSYGGIRSDICLIC